MAKGFLSGLFQKKQKDAPEQNGDDIVSDVVEPNNAPDNSPPDQIDIGAAASASTSPISATAEPEPAATGAMAPPPAPARPEDDLHPSTPPPAPLAPPEDAKPKKGGWFTRLRDGLQRSTNKLSDGVTAIFTKRRLDDETLSDLEDLLISADLGVSTAAAVTEALAKDRYDKEISDEEVKSALAEIVAARLADHEKALTTGDAKPHVILMTGVNGAGKTTTIGKLAAHFHSQGKSVMLAAGDTFRAAAIEQLTVWGARTGAPVVSSAIGADAAGLAYDALTAAKDAGTDVLLIDTAGRLQNRKELMDELAKIVRVIRKLDPKAPHDTILVLDATVGQNAISQAGAFKEIADVSGLIMTKLDGTARGGVLVSLAEKFSLPIHYIGVGEGVEDLQPFKAMAYAQALAGVDRR